MNILFLCHQLTGGGAERVCADVANGLSRLGHKVAIMMDTSIAIVYPVLPDVQIYSCPERKGNSWIMYRIKIFFYIIVHNRLPQRGIFPHHRSVTGMATGSPGC